MMVSPLSKYAPPSADFQQQRFLRDFFLRFFQSRFWIVAIPFLWMFFFFFVPFLFVLKISFSELSLGMPPYLPIVERMSHDVIALKIHIGNYLYLVLDDLYVRAYLNSLFMAGISTVICLLIGFPMAYAIVHMPKRSQPFLLLMVVLPFWTSFLIRVYAWVGILSDQGVLNSFLLSLDLIEAPIRFLHTDFAVILGIVYCYLPFMVLPIYVALQKIDLSLLEAAYDLGCRPFRAFWYVTVPMAWSGIVSGSLLVFIPAVGEFVIPELLGGSDSLMIGRILWNEFFTNRDWPVAAAVAIAMLVFLVFPIVLLQRLQSGSKEGGY
jgi:putrescine transport system permease protein